MALMYKYKNCLIKSVLYSCFLLSAMTLMTAFSSCKSEGSGSSSGGSIQNGSVDRVSKTPEENRKMSSLDLQVSIKGAPQGKYYLMGIFTDQYYKAAESEINGEELKFSLDEPVKPGLFYVLFPDQKTGIQLLIDQDQQFSITTDVNDLAGAMVVEGSADNKRFYEALRFESEIQPELTAVSTSFKQYTVGSPEHNEANEAYKVLRDKRSSTLRDMFKDEPESMFTAFKEAGQNPDLDYIYEADGTLSPGYLVKYRSQFWDNVNFADNRLLYTPVITNKLNRYFGELMPQNPDTIRKYASELVDQVLNYDDYFKYFSNWITLKYEPTKTTLMDPEAVFVHMIQNYFTDERAYWADSAQVYALQLRAYEMSGSLTGQDGPDVTANGPDGKPYSISDLKDDYIVVFMWNPDCDHCIEEMPLMIEFHNEWDDKGIDIYSIAVNTEKEKWIETVEKYKMPWINVFDPTNRAIYGKYYVDNTPEIYVLNPERKIIGKNLNVNQITTIIDRDKAGRQI